ncbi:hypothetical protein NL676_029124 [Syzygium grande]|nr:hypothetical protein NL676_029124 [Syzygium grande]
MTRTRIDPHKLTRAKPKRRRIPSSTRPSRAEPSTKHKPKLSVYRREATKEENISGSRHSDLTSQAAEERELPRVYETSPPATS